METAPSKSSTKPASRRYLRPQVKSERLVATVYGCTPNTCPANACPRGVPCSLDASCQPKCG